MEGGGTNLEVKNTKSISITVKFSGRSIAITTPQDSTVKDLKCLLQPLTNVLPRGQKLIFKGKLLTDAMTLRQLDVVNGAKVMLMASQGLHQGDGPILKEAKSQPISRAITNSKPMNETSAVGVDKNRLERWKVTGVIGLSRSNLKAIPDEVWACESSARVFDVSNNMIQELPTRVGCLSSLQKLLLNGNDLSDKSISWEGLKNLKHLVVLSLSQNHLTTLPSEFGELSSLRQLYVSHNKLDSIPAEIGLLTQLEVLKANNNRISMIPTSIGNCQSVVEVDLSSNLLTQLPEAFGNLVNLKALYLSNNGLNSLPPTLLKMCLQLSTLDLHNTEVTMDVLREFEGWGAFDERRRLKHQKQLDFRVVGSTEFDEGADKN
ncbi:hypothetical protein K2173_012279 [Erythroxylum novogranatense]|uniref:Ubiquitin-like domain-containing protein n=1 Tax=Erythroxylum novogranatense TaxID=1862640 RepID=A0AAV8SC16_9ROSI|nr:hypothetical protein K2173_012279 [Erythroxylum novogranatense]